MIWLGCIRLFNFVLTSEISTTNTSAPPCNTTTARVLHLLLMIVIDKNHQSAERPCVWWPEGDVYGHSKLSMVMYAIIKRYAGSPRKFVFLQSSSPDVQWEGGGGKTNISLLESSEEWAFGLKTSTIKDRTQKFGEKRKVTGHLIKK